MKQFYFSRTVQLVLIFAIGTGLAFTQFDDLDLQARVAPSAPSGCTATPNPFSSSPGTTIPTSGTIMDTIVVSTSDTYIWDIDLTTNIEHVFNEDLIMTISHNGITVVLGSRNGGGFSNIYDGTVWDDSSDTLVGDYAQSGTAPDLIPEGALGAFIGQDPNGTWTLTVEDADGSHGGGTLQSWALDIVTLDRPPTNPTDTFSYSIQRSFSDTVPYFETITTSGLDSFVREVQVFTDIDHNHPADMDMVLRYQKDAIDIAVTLTTDNGGGDDDVFRGTTWHDDAGTGNEATDYPYSNGVLAANLVPEGALSAFIGLDPNADWTLEILDDRAGDNGVVVSWNVQITTCACPSINVSPTSITTNESGSTADVTVSLSDRPGSDVDLDFTNGDATEGSLSASTLTFTTSNWDTAQTLTVTGVDDMTADGTQMYTITTEPASSSDPGYNTINPTDISVTNQESGFTVTASGNIDTDETGGTENFSVVLVSQPTATVTIPVASSNTSEGTVSPTMLEFTTANWNNALFVTVTGEDDNVVDGPVNYDIQVGPTSSADMAYHNLPAQVLAATNADNDVAGFVIDDGDGNMDVNESGSITDSFTVRLSSQPVTNDVVIPISSSNTGTATVSQSSLTFGVFNWDTPQSVTVTGVDNDIDAPDASFSVVLGTSTSSDPNYNGIDPADISGTNADDDTAGFTVSYSPADGRIDTTEAGGSDQFSVILNSQPITNVTLPLGLSDGTEASLSTSEVMFTPANWNNAFFVTVTGLDDDIDDGDQTYSINLNATSSSDPNYNNIDLNDLVGRTTDDGDTAGITIVTNGNDGRMDTGEPDLNDNFTVVLTSEPTANVQISFSSSDTSEATVSHGTLTFGASNWNTARTVTVFGVNDNLIDGSQDYTIQIGPVSSSDGLYSAMDPADLPGTTTDDDTPGVTVVTAGSDGRMDTSESGPGTDSFTMVLDTQPANTVTIPIASSDTGEATVSPTSVSFDASNWNNAATVTVTGVNDDVDDDDQSFTVTLGPAQSSDSNYNGFTIPSLPGGNIDDDTAAITVTLDPADGQLNTTEGGGIDRFNIVLESEPTTTVSFATAVSDPAEAELDPAETLRFGPSNWDVPRTVIVRGLDEDIDDGDAAYTVVISSASTSDPKYSGMNPADLPGINLDNDEFGVTIQIAGGDGRIDTSEIGGTDTFTVRLRSEPVAPVTVPFSIPNAQEASISPTSLNFTSENWDQAMTVTVTGEDDLIDDDNVTYDVRINAFTSTDPNYGGFDPPDLAGLNIDNDTAGITATISPADGLLLTNEQGNVTDRFTVVLDTQPVAAVTIPLSVSDTSEMSLSSSSVSFSDQNWNTEQVITVTGIDDDIDDGNVTLTVTLGAATGSDPKYSGMDPADFSGRNDDDDTAGYNIILTNGTDTLQTDEDEATDTFRMALESEPLGTVRIGVASSDTDEGTVSPSELTFTSQNWAELQTVTVTGVDDMVIDQAQNYTIQLTLVASDSTYNGLEPPDINAVNTPINLPPTATSVWLTAVEGMTGNEVFPFVDDPDPGDVHRIQLGNPLPALGTVNINPGNDMLSDSLSLTAGNTAGRETFPYTVFDRLSASVAGTGNIIVLPLEWALLAEAWEHTRILPNDDRLILTLISLIDTPTNYSNGGPNAEPDRFFANQGQNPILSPLANDTDPDVYDELTINSIGTVTNGSAEIINDGTAIRFTPTTNFTGTETFEYTVRDRFGVVSQPGLITVGILPTTAGSTCGNAPVISFTVGSNEEVIINGDNTGLTDDINGCDVSETWEDAWYSLVIPDVTESTLVRIHTQGSAVGVNTTLSLYSQDCNVRIQCNNDISGADRRSRITFDASDPQIRNSTVRILVESDAPAGAFVLTVHTP